MSLEKELETRRRLVQKLLMKGWTQVDIAQELGVHPQTIHNDVKELNGRYEKLVSENPNYLKRQMDKIFRFIDKFNLLIAEYWELKEQANTFIEYTDKHGVKKKIPLGDLDTQRKMLDSIRTTMVEQARILKVLGDRGDKYFQTNYIHIDQINNHIKPLVNHVIFLIKKFVIVEQQREALELLNNFSFKQEKK